MIVVPTEKRFDWQHTPVVLCVIVLINVLVFFFYQSDDDEKAYDAVTHYNALNLLDTEHSLFQQYLEQNNEHQLLQDINALYDDDLSSTILFRRDFYEHLVTNGASLMGESAYEQWQPQREEIQTQFDSTSPIAHGLSAKYFKLSALISHQFLHGDIMHLMGNLFFLVLCGFAVEAAIGHWRFLLFYLISGVAAGMAQVMADWQSSVPLIGASGSISGVMAMYLAIFRLKKIEFFYWIFFFVGYFRAPALLLLPIYIAKELISYYTSPDSNVAFLAHAGGFVAGSVLIGITLLFRPKTINQEYIEQDQDVDPNQQPLGEIYDALGHYQFAKAFALINQLVKEKGLTYDLAMLHYNLLKISKQKGYAASVLTLWKFQRYATHELESVIQVWKDNPALHEKLTDKDAIRLGIHLTRASDPRWAASIFLQLMNNNCKDPSVSIFAQKVSASFGAVGNNKQQKKFDSLAKELLAADHYDAL
ncbi:MAG: membrane associated rhomboid family serine protease [Flavobacteriales bacterium]|jgi:membrane associated rhomboid family serine protease